MRRRAIDSLLPHMPKRIGTFWIEVARLVTLQRHRTPPDEKDETPPGRDNTRGTHELRDPGVHISRKTRVKRNVTKKMPHS
jgi:hypothetical protein